MEIRSSRDSAVVDNRTVADSPSLSGFLDASSGSRSVAAHVGFVSHNNNNLRTPDPKSNRGDDRSSNDVSSGSPAGARSPERRSSPLSSDRDAFRAPSVLASRVDRRTASSPGFQTRTSSPEGSGPMGLPHSNSSTALRVPVDEFPVVAPSAAPSATAFFIPDEEVIPERVESSPEDSLVPALGAKRSDGTSEEVAAERVDGKVEETLKRRSSGSPLRSAQPTTNSELDGTDTTSGSSHGQPAHLAASLPTGGSTPARNSSGFSASLNNGHLSKSKKSWYSALTPTYKTRSEEFVRLFGSGMQPDERLIVDYSCALQRDILVHGRLYVSQNRICFYAKIMGWVTQVSIACKDISAMTKEKTARTNVKIPVVAKMHARAKRVIPNAIQIVSLPPSSGSSSNGAKQEKHFFTSFSGRDKSYLMLFRVWQNALLDQPMSMQELWQWVHFCYGEELGLTAEDSDYMQPGVGRGSGGSGGSGARKKLSTNSAFLGGSYERRSLASSLSFSESVTDEDVKKRISIGADAFSAAPVEKAVDAMNQHDLSYSGLSTSEMDEEGRGVGRVGGSASASASARNPPPVSGSRSDAGPPERPPRRYKTRAGPGTRSNSDTDGGGERGASVGLGSRSTTVPKSLATMSEPETARRESRGGRYSSDGAVAAAPAPAKGAAPRSRNQSLSSSGQKRQAPPPASLSIERSSRHETEERGSVERASHDRDAPSANATSTTTPKGQSAAHLAAKRGSPQHGPRTRAEAAHGGHHHTSLYTDETTGDEGEGDHDRPESFCPCTSHLPVLVLNKVVDMSVDRLHNLLFTDNTWNREFVVASKRTDYSSSPWTVEGAPSPGVHAPSPAAVAMSGGTRKRMLKYVVHLKPTIGPKTANVTETQSVHGYSVPGDIYVIDTDVKNTGIPYGDNFFINSRYCLTRVSKRQSRIRVTAEIRYTKSVWGLVKNMIEKNSVQGLNDHFTLLGSELVKESSRLFRLREAGKEKATNQDPKTNPQAKRRTRRLKPRSSRDSMCDGGSGAVETLEAESAVRNDLGTESHGLPPIGRRLSIASSLAPDSSSTEGAAEGVWTCLKILVFTFALLLFFNAVLFFKVKDLENRQEPKGFDAFDIHDDVMRMMDGMSGQKTVEKSTEEWLRILRKQQIVHETELDKWHRVLDATMDAMSQMQESLRILHDSVGSRRRRRDVKPDEGVDAWLRSLAESPTESCETQDSAKSGPFILSGKNAAPHSPRQ